MNQAKNHSISLTLNPMDNFLDLVKEEDTWIATMVEKGAPKLFLANKVTCTHIC